MSRLRFVWWGHFWRGWLQWGRAARILADKDYSVHTLWAYHVGPLEIEWWNRPDWRVFCYTKAEADAADKEEFTPILIPPAPQPHTSQPAQQGEK